MDDDQQDAMDSAIFAGRVLIAVMAVRDATGCSIHEAIDAVAARHDLLRTERSDDFNVSREEWGRHFYS